MKMTTYLEFNGQCEEAFRFYAQVLGGKIEAMMRFAGTPAEADLPAEMSHKIMHGALSLDGTVLMGSDSAPEYYQAPQGFALALNYTDPARAERIFHALSQGGTVSVPIAETFWARRFGMVTDRFGTPWMINCDY